MKTAVSVLVSLVACFAAPALAEPVQTTNTHSCAVVDADGGRYDLGDAYSSSQDWTFTDSHSEDEDGEIYTVQFCGNVNSRPQQCSGNAMAFRTLTSDTSVCNALSGPYVSTGQQPYSTGSYDRDDAELGYSVTYLHGDKGANCPNGYQFRIMMGCDETRPFPAPGNSKPYEEYIKKIDECTDELHIFSVLGCPKQCYPEQDSYTVPQEDREGWVCSAGGMCGFDRDTKEPHCFCYSGFIDYDCGSHPGVNPAGAITGAVFGGLAMGLLAFGAFYYMTHVHNKQGGSAAVGSGDGYYAQDS